MSQIEACKELKNYNDVLVYEILESVAKNPKFFYKVRKHALRSLEAIQVSAFSAYLSHEKSFLIEYYNQRNFNEKIGFYKSNDFRNILEYYVNTYLLRSLAKSKERKLIVSDDALKIKQSAINATNASRNVTGIQIQGLTGSLGQEPGIDTLNLNFQHLNNDSNDQDEDDIKNQEHQSRNETQ